MEEVGDGGGLSSIDQSEPLLSRLWWGSCKNGFPSRAAISAAAHQRLDSLLVVVHWPSRGNPKKFQLQLTAKYQTVSTRYTTCYYSKFGI